MIGNTIFIKNNYDNLSILSVKVDGKECDVPSYILSGMRPLNISGCIDYDNLSTNTPEIVVVTDKGIMSKYVYVKDAINHLVNSIAEIESSMPNAFSFTNQNGVELDTITYSNALTPTGYDGSLSVSIIGDGSPQLSINGGDWVTSSNINLDDNLTIRLTSANDYETLRSAVLTLGDYSTTWDIITKTDSSYTGMCEGLSGDWIEVPADGYFTTNNFCVMKYEAKKGGGIATSLASGNPWTSIDFPNSRTACSNIGSGYRLITNKQWMTIARNAELNPNNWADGNVGSLVSNGGGMFRGNVNLNDAVSCNPGSVLDGNTAGTNCLISGGIHDGRNKRTLELSNGELIWDFSGNVWQWVDAMEDGSSLATGTACSGDSNIWYSFVGNDGQSECSFDQSNPAYRKTNANDKRFEMGPLGNYNANNGICRIYSSTNTLRALLRGGHHHYVASAGPFAAFLLCAPSGSPHTRSSLGFRCVYEP